jgi:hypothetical protein
MLDSVNADRHILVDKPNVDSEREAMLSRQDWRTPNFEDRSLQLAASGLSKEH